MIKIVVLVLIVFFQLEGFSQDSSSLTRHISLGLGFIHSSLQDEVFSPLVYRGSGFFLDLGFVNNGERETHEVSVGFSSQVLSPTLNTQSLGEVENTLAFLDYGYSRTISHKKWKHQIGLGLFNFLSARNYIFLVEDEISVDFFSSLNAMYALQRDFNSQHHIGFRVSYPLVGYVLGRMRVPNDFSEEIFQAIVEDPNAIPVDAVLKSGDFLTLNDFRDVRVRLEYFYELSTHFRLGAHYAFRYYNYPKFLPIRNGMSQYTAKIAYTF